MSPTDLLPALNGLAVTDAAVTPDLVVAAVTSTVPTARCPACGQPSDRVHSQYRRTLADLPLGGRRFVLRLTARRFFCQHPGCDRVVFCERLPALADTHARSTVRLAGLHRAIGYVLGGEPGSRMADALAAPASGDTLLRRVQAAPAEPEPAYRFVGIDDFALRKGHTYGTMLIDLERGRVIDILDGRDGSAVEEWLKAHPGVEVITRDRWAAYANAAAVGAPQAAQVADRFHLVKNLRELVERIFETHATALDVALRPAVEPPAPPAAPTPISGRTPVGEPTRPAASPRWAARFAEVKRLRAGGAGIRRIARELGMSVTTVRRYLRRDRCPDRTGGRPRPAQLDRVRDRVDAYVRSGGRNAAELLRRLRGDGVRTLPASVRRFLNRRLAATGQGRVPAAGTATKRPSVRQLSFEFVRRAEKRSGGEAARMSAVAGVAGLAEELELAGEFLGMARRTVDTPLADWLTRAAGAASAAVRSFAASLRTDEAAVAAGLTTAWSNGQVEGHVNRLKLVKRSMYGRAGFRLLSARVRDKP